MWVYMGNAMNAIVCGLHLQFQGHWLLLKGQILAIFRILAEFSYTEIDNPMASIYNTYICPL